MSTNRTPAGVTAGGQFAVSARTEADVDLRVLYHATPVDLDDQEFLQPPSATGAEPNWEGMDEDELDLVFMTDTLDSARGWGSDLAGQYGEKFHVYEVEAPDAEQSGPPGMYVARHARISRRVFTYDPAEDEE